jgi:molybdopterin molybdotransferase
MTAGLETRASGGLLEPDAAWAAVAEAVKPLAPVDVPIAHAGGRVLVEPARAATDLPPFDRSSMDGFAVRAADTGGPLRLTGEVAAGGAPPPPLSPGTAMGISTGAALPPRADAILPSELAEVRDGTVVPAEPVGEGRFVRFRGEDVRAGDVLVEAGRTLAVQHLVSLASAGVAEVRVHERPHVHLVINGDELQAPGTPLRPGAVYESNGLALRHLAKRSGARVTEGPVVGDRAGDVREAIAAGLSADVLLVSGGMSVGPHDHVKGALGACGVREIFWRVSIKPGRPLWFGRHRRTLVFGLPGNPLSSLVGFLLFVEPALRRLQGDGAAVARRVRGRLATPVAPEDGRTTLLTAVLERTADGVLLARPTARQGSHMTGALGESDGFAVIPKDAGRLRAGDPVDVLPLGDPWAAAR